METKERIKKTIFDNRILLLHGYNYDRANVKMNLGIANFNKQFNLHVDAQSVIIFDDNLFFTHESFYYITNGKMTVIPYCDLVKTSIGNDGDLVFLMKDGTSYSILKEEEKLILDKVEDLFNKIVEIIANDPIPYKDQLDKMRRQNRNWSIVGYVITAVIIGVILLAFATCYRLCSEDARMEKEEQAVEDSLERERLESEKELLEINKLLYEGQRALNEAEAFSSGKGSTDYAQELGHIKVNGTYSINSGKHFGCREQVYLHLLIDLAVSGNMAKFHTMLQKGLSSGECIYFETRELVTVQETNYDKTEVRVRRMGETTSYWTPVEAIE